MLRLALASLAWPYSAAVRLRNSSFDCGLRTVKRVGVPVISVGNITTGGTGKTPIVALVTSILQQAGKRPAIVSRGYRADATGTNDEKRVLDQLCPGVHHVQATDRHAAAGEAIERHGADAIVMDDGLQHRRLHRDLNIVLIDACNPFGYGYLLPRGLLREPLTALRRADVVLITRCDLVDAARLREIESRVVSVSPQLQDSMLHTRFAPVTLSGHSGDKMPIATARGRRVFLMSALGNPEAFESTCRAVGLVVTGHSIFPDHHHYSDSDLDSIRNELRNSSAELLVTSWKDLVKIPASATDIVAVDIAPRFDREAEEALFRRLLLAAANR